MALVAMARDTGRTSRFADSYDFGVTGVGYKHIHPNRCWQLVSEKRMSKTPGEYEPRKPISKEVRDVRKVLRDADAKSAMIEHANAAKAFDKNRERLKAERLAREAVAPPPLLPKKKKAGLKTKGS